MRYRLHPPELTSEDYEILGLRILRATPPDGHRFVVALNTLGLYHDTQDAELVYLLVQWATNKHDGVNGRIKHNSWAFYGLAYWELECLI